MRWTVLLLLALAPVMPASVLAAEPPMHLPPPVPPPPPENCTGAEYRQFDFWVGNWDVVTTGKPEEMKAGSRIESINFGCGIRETWLPFTSLNGASLSIYDKYDRTWHQSWIDASGDRVEFQGGLKDGKMIMTGLWRGVFGPGKDAIMRMTWSPAQNGQVRQVGETSVDQGKTWQPSFDFTYQPRRS
jgi:hypothetical protein